MKWLKEKPLKEKQKILKNLQHGILQKKKAEDAAQRKRKAGYRARVSKETEKKGIYRVRYKKR